MLHLLQACNFPRVLVLIKESWVLWLFLTTCQIPKIDLLANDDQVDFAKKNVANLPKYGIFLGIEV